MKSLPVGPLAALALGAIAVVAFAPFGWFPLMPITLAALFRLAENQRPQRAFLLGWLFGFAEFAFGVYWIYISVHLIGNAPIWLAVLMLFALVAAMGVFSATVLWAAAYLAPARGWRRYLIALPALWALIEWVRSWILSGFPWLAAGYSQIDSPLAGYGPIAGVFGISFTVALTAGLVVLIFASERRSPMLAQRRRMLALAALILVWVLGFWLRAVNWTQPVGPSFTVSLVQGNIAQSTKWNEHAFAQSLKRYRDLTLKHLGSDVIIWPETAIPALLRDVAANYVLPLADQVVAHGGKLVLGVPVWHGLNEGHKPIYYNAVVVLNGTHPQFYYKEHLVPFGEYFPVPHWVRRWLKYMNLPYSSYAPGSTDQAPVDLGRWKAAISICYEDAFGAQLIRMLPTANLLINVSDDAWFGDSIALPQHLQIVRMRALEAGRFAVRATNTGISAIVGPHGQVLKRLPIDTVGVLTGKVRPYGGATPYALAGGNLPLVFALLAILFGATIAAIQERRWQKARTQ
ncbi:MAG TPA: apolipoprotein N-acyltransferase [Gammaproteobacteria bacterium]|nr:apolipoprotein N-acyltransferase [Gammaproteobacteria bacterium]